MKKDIDRDRKNRKKVENGRKTVKNKASGKSKRPVTEIWDFNLDDEIEAQNKSKDAVEAYGERMPDEPVSLDTGTLELLEVEKRVGKATLKAVSEEAEEESLCPEGAGGGRTSCPEEACGGGGRGASRPEEACGGGGRGASRPEEACGAGGRAPCSEEAHAAGGGIAGPKEAFGCFRARPGGRKSFLRDKGAEGRGGCGRRRDF